MTLQEAVAVFGADYPMKVSTLRTAITCGRLVAPRVGGKYFVTPAQIRALFRPSETDEAVAAQRRGIDQRIRRGGEAAATVHKAADAERLAAAQVALDAALTSLKSRPRRSR